MCRSFCTPLSQHCKAEFLCNKDFCLSIQLWIYFFYCFDHFLPSLLSSGNLIVKVKYLDGFTVYASSELKFLYFFLGRWVLFMVEDPALGPWAGIFKLKEKKKCINRLLIYSPSIFQTSWNTSFTDGTPHFLLAYSFVFPTFYFIFRH